MKFPNLPFTEMVTNKTGPLEVRDEVRGSDLANASSLMPYSLAQGTKSPLLGDIFCLSLCLYGIREPASDLGLEVDQSFTNKKKALFYHKNEYVMVMCL